MLSNEQLKQIQGRWVTRDCSMCTHAYAERCIECAATDVPALLDTVKELRELLERAESCLAYEDRQDDIVGREIKEALR